MSEKEWMSILIEVPFDTGCEILNQAEDRGFVDVDHCEKEIPGGKGRLTFGPCEIPRSLREQAGNTDAVTREDTA